MISGTKVLYLCYFGLREPLVQTQVLPYLRGLVADGFQISLVTFEPRMNSSWSVDERSSMRTKLKEEGIGWIALPYHKRPTLPATLYDIVRGGLLASRLVKREGIDLLHARGHVPAAMAWIAKSVTGARMLFDIRGFMPEEYTDGGMWPAGGFLYRLTKRIERRLMSSADGFVVLTEKARNILFPGSGSSDLQGRPIEIIPCCVDFNRFSESPRGSKQEIRRILGIDAQRVIVYVGALGTWYLVDEMARFFKAAYDRNASTLAMVLTQSSPELMEGKLRALGIPQVRFMVRRVTPSEIAMYLGAADIAVSFIRPCFSKQSSSPTKIAEYLASGLPMVCNRGVGDIDDLIETDRVGTLIDEFNTDSYRAALERVEALLLEPSHRERCMASARSRFDLATTGRTRYRSIYTRILDSRRTKLVANRL
jgi:glycosyltransferase involved in cell wall biosynthesis